MTRTKAEYWYAGKSYGKDLDLAIADATVFAARNGIRQRILYADRRVACFVEPNGRVWSDV